VGRPPRRPTRPGARAASRPSAGGRTLSCGWRWGRRVRLVPPGLRARRSSSGLLLWGACRRARGGCARRRAPARAPAWQPVWARLHASRQPACLVSARYETLRHMPGSEPRRMPVGNPVPLALVPPEALLRRSGRCRRGGGQPDAAGGGAAAGLPRGGQHAGAAAPCAHAPLGGRRPAAGLRRPVRAPPDAPRVPILGRSKALHSMVR